MVLCCGRALLREESGGLASSRCGRGRLVLLRVWRAPRHVFQERGRKAGSPVIVVAPRRAAPALKTGPLLDTLLAASKTLFSSSSSSSAPSDKKSSMAVSTRIIAARARKFNERIHARGTEIPSKVSELARRRSFSFGLTCSRPRALLPMRPRPPCAPLVETGSSSSERAAVEPRSAPRRGDARARVRSNRRGLVVPPSFSLLGARADPVPPRLIPPRPAPRAHATCERTHLPYCAVHRSAPRRARRAPEGRATTPRRCRRDGAAHARRRVDRERARADRHPFPEPLKTTQHTGQEEPAARRPRRHGLLPVCRRRLW